MLMSLKERIKIENLDKLGMSLSTICAIHCLLTPILLFTMPWLYGKFEDPIVHIGMAVFVLPLGIWAFWSGYKHHHNKKVLLMGGLGLALVGIFSLMPETLLASLPKFTDEVFMIIGSVFLIAAHWVNRRSCACGHPHD